MSSECILRRVPGAVALFSGILLGLFSAVSTATSAEYCGASGAVPIADLRAGRVREGQEIVIEALVSAVFAQDQQLGGFFVQQGTPEPSGVFVYAPDLARSVQSAQQIRLRGRFAVFHGRPQVVDPVLLQVCASRVPLEPVRLRLPEDLPRLERLREVKVHFPQKLVVTGNYPLGRYGSLDLSANERLFRTPGEGTDPAQTAFQLQLDDGSYRQNPNPIPYLDAQGTRRSGDYLLGLTGILTHAFDAYRVHPTVPPQFESGNPRPPAPPAPLDTERAFRVATFNMENYFLTLRQRGASTREEQRRQRAKLRATIHSLDADVLSLVEVENRPEAVQSLVDVINQGLPRDRQYRMLSHAGTGSDTIRQAILYRPQRLRSLGIASDPDPVHQRSPLLGWFAPIKASGTVSDNVSGNLSGTVLDNVSGNLSGTVLDNVSGNLSGNVSAHAWDNAGSNVSGNARAHVSEDPRFAVVAVHFKSKVGCPRSGDVDRGQGCWNQQRVQQAQRLLRWIGEQKNGPFPVIIAGDLNAYAAEDPVRLLLRAGKRDLVQEALPDTHLYTYVFRGEAGRLDYLIGDASRAFSVLSGGIWHGNADEPPFLAYDGRFPAEGPWRSSDHDPVWVDLRFR
jgi:predicted extracellular nuclease